MSRVRQACAQRASACVSRILVPSHSGAYLSNPQSPRQLSDARRRLDKCASVDIKYSYIAFKCRLDSDSYTSAFRRPSILLTLSDPPNVLCRSSLPLYSPQFPSRSLRCPSYSDLHARRPWKNQARPVLTALTLWSPSLVGALTCPSSGLH